MKQFWKKAVISILTLAMIIVGPASILAHGKGDSKGKGNAKGKGQLQFELDGGKGKIDFKGKGKLEIKLEFKDVEEGLEWASKHIASLASKKIFEGYEDGTFQPNKPVTRVEAVATAIRLMGLKDEAESADHMKASLSFKDAKQILKKHAWAVGYLDLAVKNNLISDVNGHFQPNKPADRLWVSVLLIKALGLEDEAKAKMNTKLTFKDTKDIPAQYRGHVALAVEKNIVQGYHNHTFRPNKPVTRAELAALLDRTGNLIPEFNDGTIKGTVAAKVDANTLTILKGKESVQLSIDPNAFIYRDQAKITASQLEIGDEVLIRTYNNIVIFVEVTKSVEQVNANFIGTVHAVVYADQSLTVKKADHTTVQYKLASNANIYRDGVKVNLAALQVGDEVFVIVQNSQIIFAQVTKNVENQNFTVEGRFHSLTLNTKGELATITITKELTGGGTQESIYAVSSDVTITGNPALLKVNQPIELKGQHQIVTSIHIQ